MELVWILIFTIEHGTRDIQSHVKQIVVPHQYQSEESCRLAADTVMEADIEKQHRVFTYAPYLPGGHQYGSEYGFWIDCLPLLVD